MEWIVGFAIGIPLLLILNCIDGNKKHEEETKNRRIVNGLSTLEDVVYKTNNYRPRP